MPAQSPEEICRLFQRYMREGDIDSVMTLYDREAVFLNQAGQVRRGPAELREELSPLAASRAIFEFENRRVVRAHDLALMHTRWTVTSSRRQLQLHAIEVARRQPDGSWRWVIGDPFTVGSEVPTEALR